MATAATRGASWSSPPGCGRLFEMSHVVELARTAFAGASEVERCEFVAGDFFAEPPPASRLLLLQKVIHDWPDERAVAILRNRRAAILTGPVAADEKHIVPGKEPSFGKWLDLLMLVYAGGRERTVEEFRGLLAISGFQMEQVIPTAANVCVIEAFAA